MTEEEMRTKRCPHLETAVQIKLGVMVYLIANGGTQDVKESAEAILKDNKCIASDCALWVSTDYEYQPNKGLAAYGNPKPAGHCGLINP